MIDGEIEYKTIIMRCDEINKEAYKNFLSSTFNE